MTKSKRYAVHVTSGDGDPRVPLTEHDDIDRATFYARQTAWQLRGYTCVFDRHRGATVYVATPAGEGDWLEKEGG